MCGKKLLKDAEKVVKLGEKLMATTKWYRMGDKKKFKSMITRLKKLVGEAAKMERRKGKSKTIAIYGGGDLVKDITAAGKNIELSVLHVFDSMKNLTQDMYCESDSIMNIAKEIDTGKSGNCPFTKTQSWTFDPSTQMLKK
jgi:dihydrofolate reductase